MKKREREDRNIERTRHVCLRALCGNCALRGRNGESRSAQSGIHGKCCRRNAIAQVFAPFGVGSAKVAPGNANYSKATTWLFWIETPIAPFGVESMKIGSGNANGATIRTGNTGEFRLPSGRETVERRSRQRGILFNVSTEAAVIHGRSALRGRIGESRSG